ncbi:hypothetical protein [Actinoallomurus rhizosphaericola]|uniref:hypothetical protein n=1 Tax=Actinoallomurus rhizosphaericola TaxID=2952536 RepID=UPI002091EAA9|nr:hypothetical protein [Actinoallomurus rhizosphaericola]MCO5999017.1 hypothetical protein [Actinoallomurus rhizosphaericola]
MAISDRLVRYLGSTKNLVGSAGGLAGLGLHFAGLAGPYWPLIVVGLYGAGALAAPPQRVTLVIDDTVAQTGRLRADLDGLVARAGEHRLPAEARERVDVIASVLRDVLLRSDVLSDSPDLMYEVSRAVRTDLPTSLETYLNLPRWYAVRRTGHGTAGEELIAQLDLITASVTRTAEAVYDADHRRMRDHTRYLRDREPDDNLGWPPRTG